MHQLRVFEHQRIYIDEQGFTSYHLASLAQFNQLHDGRYFEVLHNGVRFKQYVGVLQIGQLNIEILPKIDQYSTEDAAAWQQILIDLLQQSQLLGLEVLPKGQLHSGARQLLPLFVQVFLQEVEQVLQSGVLREYQTQEGAYPFWKGQVKFPQQQLLQIQRPHHCYSRHQAYSSQHRWYQLLAEALKVLLQLPLPDSLLRHSRQLLDRLPSQAPLRVQAQHFQELVYTPKTQGYRRALQLAELFCLQHHPNLQAGYYPVLGLLFDMNQLFEHYIYEQLRKVIGTGWQLRRQESRVFWEQQSLRPDLLLQYGAQKWVLELKWKLLQGPRPNEQDLRQLYVYQQQFGATEGWLLYPAREQTSSYVGEFGRNLLAEEQPAQRARLVWLPVLNEQGQLNKHLGQEILALALSSIDNQPIV